MLNFIQLVHRQLILGCLVVIVGTAGHKLELWYVGAQICHDRHLFPTFAALFARILEVSHDSHT